MTILKALVTEHAHFTHPGNTGVVGEEVGRKHGEDGVEMIEDYLWAIGDTRMTVSGEMVGQFLEDIDALARL